jgi:hypothetical protein
LRRALRDVRGLLAMRSSGVMVKALIVVEPCAGRQSSPDRQVPRLAGRTSALGNRSETMHVRQRSPASLRWRRGRASLPTVPGAA